MPDFIKRVGIMERRQALLVIEDQKTSKTKMQKRVRFKLGKHDIDSQKLLNGVFKRSVEPKVTIHEDLCYEGEATSTCIVGPKKDGEETTKERPPSRDGCCGKV
ncbi:hypothetical protein TNIN_78411 [Trichonephila inaurata madagascariensis]|uniref:DUF382 domain-containing protein n=1 Tax=Trichonephila inaurata madagascariensis TaxID=2747483 RepID=A0A8X7CAK0_9ARAC|nr:hypothetical protein TNIN_78411 [Trichonephila inaurata madagascariensis]